MNVSHLPGGSLARSVTAIQARIATARSEMVTGQLADPVATLGAGRGRTLSLEAEAGRFDRIREGNSLVTGRLEATAAQIRRIGETADGMVGTLVGAMSGALDRDFVREAASTARRQVTQALNATHSGVHLFAGVTSDVTPIRDGTDAAAALEARFATRFGHASDDSAAASIAPDDAADFALDAAAWLVDAGWPLVSDASDDTVNARIAPGESVESTLSANERAARDAFAGAFVTERLFGSALGDAALSGVAGALLGRNASAASGAAALEGRIGLTEARVTRASERLAEDAGILRDLVARTVGVDPFEAAQEFQSSVTQLETAYALTGRLSQLSLMRFL